MKSSVSLFQTLSNFASTANSVSEILRVQKETQVQLRALICECLCARVKRTLMLSELTGKTTTKIIIKSSKIKQKRSAVLRRVGDMATVAHVLACTVLYFEFFISCWVCVCVCSFPFWKFAYTNKYVHV